MSLSSAALTQGTYLAASALFILGLKRLSSPATARSGNLLGALGMFLAIGVTLLDREILSFRLIAIGLAVGSALGVVAAWAIKMTAMPQLVAVLNGLGGGASALVAWSESLRLAARPPDVSVTIMTSVVIGAATLSGSLIAFAKLQELVPGRPVTYPLQHVSNGLLLAGLVVLGGYLAVSGTQATLFSVLLGLSVAFGVLLVMPIGGADMPVVIAFLNACSGMAAASTGFVLHNNMLLIAGALVGASGMILTSIMCRAMNRSLGNVLFGAFGKVQAAPAGAASTGERIAREITVEDAALLLRYAASVIVVPGYGMAVAQAQHAMRDLADALEAHGVAVKYAIHPVAGRMPGHMNVLLAEANVPYDRLYEMDRINPEFDRADVALVVGANDVTNPAARTDPASPLYGMPILNADRAKHAIVVKRSLRPGFAGVDNALFYAERTRMLFKDARAALTDLAAAAKAG